MSTMSWTRSGLRFFRYSAAQVFAGKFIYFLLAAIEGFAPYQQEALLQKVMGLLRPDGVLLVVAQQPEDQVRALFARPSLRLRLTCCGGLPDVRRGTSRRPTHPAHGGNNSWEKPSAPRIFPAMKSERSSRVRGPW